MTKPDDEKLSDNQRAMLAWAERFIEENPPPPLTDRQKDVLALVGEHMPSLQRWAQGGDD